MNFLIYILNVKNLKFIIDEGCICLGNFFIDMLDIFNGMDCGMIVNMMFRGIEFVVMVVDKDNFFKKMFWFLLIFLDELKNIKSILWILELYVNILLLCIISLLL